MAEASKTANRAADTDYSRWSADMLRQWEKAMGAWWDEVLESPSFLGGVNQNLAGASRARGAWTRAVDDWMEQAHLPSRSDLVRAVRIATLLEEKLLAQEDLLLELMDRLEKAEKDALEARIEAAEARLEVRERLDAILSRLDAAPVAEAPSAAVSAAEPGRAARRARGGA